MVVALAAILLGSCGGQAIDDEQRLRPPDGLACWVQRWWPGFRLAEAGDFDAELLTYLASRGETSQPGRIAGDFDGDGESDHGLLLVPLDDERKQVLLAAILEARGGAPRGVLFERLDPEEARRGGAGRGLTIYLTREEKGAVISPPTSIDTPDQGGRVLLGADGLRVDYFERSACVYYFAAGKVKSLWVVD